MALLCAIITFAFAPGHMDADALGMIKMAQDNFYNDWHPPFLEFLLRISLLLHLGPGAVLAFQVFCVGLSVYAIFAAFSAPVVASICTCGVLLCPAVLGYLGAITTHALLAACLLPAVAALLYVGRSARVRFRMLLLATAFVLLSAANISRVNAIAYTLPGFCVFTSLLLARTDGAGTRRRLNLAVSLRLGFVITLGSYFVTNSFVNKVLHVGKSEPAQQIVLFDLAAISLKSSHLFLDPLHFPAQDLGLLRQNFNPEIVDTLVYRGPASILHFNPDRQSYNELMRMWRGCIVMYPRDYLQERTAMMVPLLGLDLRKAEYVPFHPGIDANGLGYHISNPKADGIMVGYLTAFSNTFWDRPWVYVVILCVAVVGLFLQRSVRGYPLLTILALAIGSCLYLASYFFAAPGALFRYTWPSVVGDVVVTFAVIAIYLNSAWERSVRSRTRVIARPDHGRTFVGGPDAN